MELSEWLQRGSVSVTELGTEGKLKTPFPTVSALPASCLRDDNHGDLLKKVKEGICKEGAHLHQLLQHAPILLLRSSCCSMP